MASPAAGRDVPNVREESERSEPNQPEPACQEAQKWIEAVTGKSFGDKDFRSGLENGILLCELLSAIKPGLVKKINRLPTPIAGLDNLSVFLRGCEELGLKGAQLFDPGDLQDTSIRANLKDSDCNRKLKNVLNTVFWLGKAASGCASYSGPTLNLKEFEGLLAQMKVESDEPAESPQKRGGVRDSGYDCWDSERSESLSPPRHTRDNSLDSLDSFGSRSQHSPSPDVVNRGNSDGRGSDSEADPSGKRPDVRKDDMSARRTASSESRTSIPFNQFLPNRTNASSYIPAPRRKPHAEEGEQRSQHQAAPEQSKRPGPLHRPLKTVTWAREDDVEKVEEKEEQVPQEVFEQRRLQKLQKAGIKVLPAAARYSSPSQPTAGEQEVRSPSPSIILRCDNDFLSPQKSALDSTSDGEAEAAEVRKVPDVRRDDLASRRARRGPVNPKVHQFVPPPICSSKDRERWEGIRRASQQTLQEKDISDKEAIPDIITRRDNPFLHSLAPRHEEEEDEEKEEGEEGKVMPNKQKDDLAQRRAQSRPRPHRDGPMSFVSASMSQADVQKWERLKMTEPSEDSPASPVCRACLEKNHGSPLGGSAKSGRGHSKVVTFGGVTEIEQPIDTVTSGEGEETELLRRLLSKATVAMPTIGLGAQLSERGRSHMDGADLNQASPPSADLRPWTLDKPSTPAELDARLAQYEQRAEKDEEDEEEEEERIPDLQKDDMMARRTGVFQKQSVASASYNRFLPLPASRRSAQGEVTTDAAPRNKMAVQAARKLHVRPEPSVPVETPQPHPDVAIIRCDDEEDENEENEPAPDLEKDDMMARRTGSFQKPAAARSQSANQFLPVPGSVRYSVAPVSAFKPLRNRPKVSETLASESGIAPAMQADPQAPPSRAPPLTHIVEVKKRREEEEEEEEEDGKQKGEATLPHSSEPSSSPLTPPPPPPPSSAAFTCKTETELEKQEVEEGCEEVEEEERKMDVKEEPQKKPFWLDDDDLPPMMISRRLGFMSEDTESVSMGDMLSEDEVGHLPPLSQSRCERMHEQYNSFVEEDEHWQDDLARWKNRRRSASQELIKKEEERKRMEKKMKEEGSDSNKRKSIKTYKEIVEDKERREAELCDAYRSAATPEEAAMVLQRYALRFTISDATLDSLKVPRTTAKAKYDPNQVEMELKTTTTTAGTSESLHKAAAAEQTATKAEEKETTSVLASSSPPAPASPPHPVTSSANEPPPSLQLNEPPSEPTQRPAADVTQPEPQITPAPPSQSAQVQPLITPPAHTLPSPPSVAPRPVPLLVAKPYCQPRTAQSGHKSVKVDGLIRVNGDLTVDSSVSTSPSSPGRSPAETKDAASEQATEESSSSKTEEHVPSEKTVENVLKQKEEHVLSEKTVENVLKQTEEHVPSEKTVEDVHKQTEERDVSTKTAGDVPSEQPVVNQELAESDKSSTTSSGSAISSLIGGRNCIITTTIVTELTQTRVEPQSPDIQNHTSRQVNGGVVVSEGPVDQRRVTSPSSMQEYSPTVTEGLEESSITIETPMLNLAKRVNHWVWDPNEERKRLESWQQEQERLLQEQYQREQEKLKKEWEKAQLEVEEEERKHNEEERKILEETVAPLNPAGLLHQPSDEKPMTPPALENKAEEGNIPLQQNGQRILPGKEDQHASKLLFFQDSSVDGDSAKKQELWKTASLDRNPQLNQAHMVKRSESHDAVTNSSSPQPPSPSRCVSGKRLCSGCSQPLGKGAAMIIDTLGLFFHMQCFKCGVCSGQLGDATVGTDVRIRNGQLSCHECYLASRGRGQPTTL
ncbi:uncharacterized protein V6R79_003921 [Siganus canaliculatus]